MKLFIILLVMMSLIFGGGYMTIRMYKKFTRAKDVVTNPALVIDTKGAATLATAVSAIPADDVVVGRADGFICTRTIYYCQGVGGVSLIRGNTVYFTDKTKRVLRSQFGGVIPQPQESEKDEKSRKVGSRVVAGS